VSSDGTPGGSPSDGASRGDARLARRRYGATLGLTILAVTFAIFAPDTPLGRAVTVLLQCAMLSVVIATARVSGRSRWDPTRRRVAASLTITAILALAVLVGLQAIPRWAGAVGSVIAVLAVLVVLVTGVVRLIREDGVSVQAVAGALTTYLLIGLEFALVISVLVDVTPHQYFGQVTDAAVTQSQEIYFSFTTLTTTGYGDLTPVLNAGRALSVLEMLLGQIYLVTVIGLLVGNLRHRPERMAEG
jgi:Ion channel